MEVSVLRGELWTGIEAVLDAVPTRPAMPILANMVLSAAEDGLQLAASDLDLSLRTIVPAQVHEFGSVAVPARTLAEIAREWPEAELTIAYSDDTVRLEGSLGAQGTGRATYTLAGVSADEFPPFPEGLSGTALKLNSIEGLSAATVGDMIQRVSFAVSREETRPVLGGALWRIDTSGVLLVATDAHRFAHYRHRADLTAQIGTSTREAIVPAPALARMARLLSNAPEETTLEFADTHLSVQAGPTELVTRLIEGPYVDYDQVIPRNNRRRLEVALDDLLPAVRRVSVLASSYTHQIRLALTPGTVELSANSPELGGEAREVISAAYDGEPMQTGYNAQYLIEILRRIGSKSVVFELGGELTAALLRPADQQESQDYFCLLMPLRVAG